MAEKKKKPEGEGEGGGDMWLWIIIIFIVLAIGIFGLSARPFNPSYLNLEYFFAKILPFFNSVKNFLLDGHMWATIGIISSLCSILIIGVIIYSLVRMYEIQVHEKKEINHEIKEAMARDMEKEREENPRWRYIQTLIESPNESDWRVAIIESDTMLLEVLAERGYEGDTVAEKLKGATATSFPSIQNAWDAHAVRNEIAHGGSDFPLSQVEARRVIKMFQNVFEELNVI